MRYDLAFFSCCCKSFLGESESSSENFYQLLGVECDASPNEIKRAYKRKSLEMHPDKLAQRGRVVTKEDQAKFTRMKEAYECISDPHKRETYDSIGERGMKFLDEPMSVDPQELARNFTRASTLDRSKIFVIFVAIALAVSALPIVVCLQIDGSFGHDASWMVTLTPLWICNALVAFYHVRVIMMPDIPRPEDVPLEEWIDPLPMNQRIFSFVRFLWVFIFELLLALKLDDILKCKWAFIFFPLYVWEATIFYGNWTKARLKIITVEDLETEILGRSFVDLTSEEEELIRAQYFVVQSTTSPDFQVAHEIKECARQDLMKCSFRVLFFILFVIQIDTNIDFDWWLVFAPIWIMIILICIADYRAFAKVQLMAAKKDPELFGLFNDQNDDEEMGSNNFSNTGYGSVGRDGTATPEAASAATFPRSELSEEEKEKLKEQVVNSGTILCTQCLSLGFVIILVALIVCKLQGASFSTLWIISPFLFAIGITLCCLGCGIFGISEIPNDNGVEFDSENMTNFVGDNSDFRNTAGAPISSQEMSQNERVKSKQTSDSKFELHIAQGSTASKSNNDGSTENETTMQIRELD